MVIPSEVAHAPTSASSDELDTLNRQIEGLKNKLRECESQIELLRQENQRLEEQVTTSIIVSVWNPMY